MDYAAIAKQYGGSTAVDYSALAKQYGGTTVAAQPSELPKRQIALSDVPFEAASNIVPSGAKFFGGLYEAVTSPVQTTKALLDVGAGTLRNVLPAPVVNFIDQFDSNPEAAQRVSAVAKAVGGMYKDRYGDYESIKRTFAEDPVGAASDLSALLSGGATVAGKVAPATAKVLSKAATLTNPVAPITAAAEYGIGMAAKGAGTAVDLLQGQRPAVSAGGILRNALTEEGRAPQNLLAAQLAMQNAPAGATVRQALADVMTPQTQYLGELIQSKTAPGAALATKQAQETGRLARLEAVTPDEVAARQARTIFSQPIYEAATLPTTPVITAPLVQNINTLLASNPGNTKLVSSLNQVKSGLEASTTAEQVSSVLDNLKDLISSKDNKLIVKNLVNVKKEIENALPGYEQAQQVFAAASPPVNQAQVLGAMKDVLQSPLGVGERAAPFMTAMGRGEQALLKKSTGAPRFAELGDVLTPAQMKVVGEVKSELLRDAQVAAQTKAGAEAMKIILDSNKSSVRLPDFMSVKVTLANQMLKILEGKINDKIMMSLEKGFQSGTDFTELMKKIPASERIEVLRALGQAQGQLSPNKLNVYTQMQRNVAPQQQESENALARPKPTNRLILE
jgi:hypothetical protein